MSQYKTVTRSGKENMAKNGKMPVVTVDWERNEVRANGRVVELALKEYLVMHMLYEAQGKVLSREHLLTEIWGYEKADLSPVLIRLIDQHVARLRGKVGAQCVKTVTGFGYRWMAYPK